MRKYICVSPTYMYHVVSKNRTRHDRKVADTGCRNCTSAIPGIVLPRRLVHSYVQPSSTLVLLVGQRRRRRRAERRSSSHATVYIALSRALGRNQV